MRLVPTPPSLRTTGSELARITVAIEQQLSSDLDWRNIADRATVRHRDPRARESFLRHLEALYPLLRRFDADELDPPCFYLCQMLRFEFPWASRSLMKDGASLRSLEPGRLNAIRLREHPESTPGLRHAPRWGRKRFLAICGAIREARESTASVSLHALFQLVERPPILTARETRLAWSAFRTAPSTERAGILRKLFAPKGVFEAARSNALIEKAVALRDRLLSRLAAEQDEPEFDHALEDVRSVTDLIATLLRDLQVVGRGRISDDACTNLVDHAIKWSKAPVDAHLGLRDDEIELLRLIVDFAPESRLRDVHERWELTRTFELRSQPRAKLTALLDHLERRLAYATPSPRPPSSVFSAAAHA